MAFRLENNPSRKIPYLLEFDETPRFWYSRVALVTWIDFNSRTVEVRPLERREKLHFLFSPLSSLSLSVFFLSLSFLLLLLFLFIFSFLSPLYIHRTSFLFALLLISFSFSIFSFLSFFSSLSFSLLFSFIFSFLSLFHYHQPNGPKVGETSPHFPPLALVISMFFPYFLFLLYPTLDI